MINHNGAFLLLLALGAIVLLILLIARFKLNPFIALMTVSLGLAAASGMPLPTIVKAFEAGVGGTLGHIAIVVALGTMLGKMMAESGGAERIALTLINIAGEKHIPLAAHQDDADIRAKALRINDVAHDEGTQSAPGLPGNRVS